MVHVRRGLSAPLSFLALLGAALGSVAASPAIWAIALVALMAAVWSSPGPSSPGRIGLVVLLFAGWIALSNAFLNPSYSAAAPYHAAFLAGGFFLGRRTLAGEAGKLYAVALLSAVALAAWALGQKTLGVVRPSAMFETPATLAACLNLILVPGIALVLVGKRGPWLLAGLTVIAAGLLVTLSRGGWLAFLAGSMVAGVLLRRAGLGMRTADLRAVAAVAFAAVLVAFAVSRIPESSSVSGGASAFSVVGPEAVRSSVARLELSALALQTLAPPLLLTGYGYLGFHYVLEAGRHAVASYEQGVSYFVHNDYLQVMLELGAPGLVGLTLIVAWPVIAAGRATARQGGPEVLSLAAAAGTASMAVHALVDFPFYVPVCLLLYGTALGMIERARAVAIADAAPTRGLARFSARALFAGLAAWLLGAPVVADLAASQAHAQWKRGATAQAAYWFEVARRLERRDGRHHWQAGQFWLVQALQNGHPEAARRADAAFADGLAANPRDVRNLLGRIETQRSLAGILPAPVDAKTLMAWSDHAVELAPSDPAVRRLRETLPGAGGWR